ncbi:MAG: carbohydrate kinase [Armatimonadetes bacterium]|nr:carbohydrate kinase [Armatimonadota bacterium]
MEQDRFLEILDGFSRVRLAVIGDFFLDKYLVIDPALAETSLETGLEAHQVVAVRHSPGAAGTVTSNLAALQAGAIHAVGAIGDDGHGYELRQGLQRTGVDLGHLLVLEDIFTPTYTKPMVIQADGTEVEANRLDIRNRRPLSEGVMERIMGGLEALLPEVDGVIIADQVAEANLGVITEATRGRLAEMAVAHPEVLFFADSRAHIGEFRQVIIKPNRREAALCLGSEEESAAGLEALAEMGRQLAHRNHRPVFITLGPEGMLACDEASATHVPGIPVTGPIDIVGAGDSATAGTVLALCAGADPAEAALFGNLVASITIQQIGTTGTASPSQVLQRYLDTFGTRS